MRVMPVVSLSVIALVLALPAVAQERSLNFALRGGVAAGPEYPGSDNYKAVGDIGLSFGSFKWGRVNVGKGVHGVPNNGLTVQGAFNVIGSREVNESPELAGLDDIDIAIELGLGLTYMQTNWMAFGNLRKGVTGHTGITGTVGADLIFRPNDNWLITAGPRVNFGDSDYANTYFGISTVEAGRSNFGAFDADGGALGAGVEVHGVYFINDKWSLDGAVGYEKLLGDAADSPITAQGSDDQWHVRFGVSRVFTLTF